MAVGAPPARSINRVVGAGARPPDLPRYLLRGHLASIAPRGYIGDRRVFAGVAPRRAEIGPAAAVFPVFRRQPPAVPGPKTGF